MNHRPPPLWRELRLGIFFLISSAIFIYSLLVVGTNQRVFERTYDLRLYMSNAQGLARGGMVTLSGLEVGKVEDIHFADNDTANVLEVTLAVNRSHRRRITGSSVATIRTVGVLGDKFVDISMGRLSETPLAEGGELPVRGEVDWAATLERVASAADDFVALTGNLAEITESATRGEGALGALLFDPTAGAQVRRTVEDMAELGRTLSGGTGTLPSLLSEREAYEKLSAILDRLDRISAEADSGSGALARIVSDRELGDRLGSLVSESDQLVSDFRTQGTTGRLVRDEQLYEDLTKALTELKGLIEDIRNNPRKYFKVSVF